MAQRQRNYGLEYKKRIDRGLAKGFSKSKARGHAVAGEQRLISTAPTQPRGSEASGLKMMKRGVSLQEAARSNRISSEKLKRYVLENTDAKYEKRRWVINDRRIFQFPFYSKGRLVEPWLNAKSIERVGRYMGEVGLAIQGRSSLKEFRGESVTDVKGRHYPFETDLNALQMIILAGEPSIPETYKIQGAL